MNKIYTYVADWGDVRFTECELKEAGVTGEFYRRYTDPDGGDGWGVLCFRPKLNADLLEDFLKLYARDEAMR